MYMYNMHCNNCIQEDEGEHDTSSDDMSSDEEAYSAIEDDLPVLDAMH